MNKSHVILSENLIAFLYKKLLPRVINKALVAAVIFLWKNNLESLNIHFVTIRNLRL